MPRPGVTNIRLGNRENWQCWYCGQPLSINVTSVGWSNRIYIGKFPYYKCEVYPEVEHKIPRSHGGPRTMENCVLACGTCNSRKRCKSADEYLEELYYWQIEYRDELAALYAHWDAILEYRHEWE